MQELQPIKLLLPAVNRQTFMETIFMAHAGGAIHLSPLTCMGYLVSKGLMSIWVLLTAMTARIMLK